MTVQSMITDGRALIEDTFIDAATITRPSLRSAGSIDPTTTVFTPGSAAAVYAGRCRVKKPSPVEMEVVFGDTQVTVQRRIVNLPFSAPEVKLDDIVEVTASLDAEVVRHPMRVCAVMSTSTLMFRAVGCEVVE